MLKLPIFSGPNIKVCKIHLMIKIYLFINNDIIMKYNDIIVKYADITLFQNLISYI